MKHVPDENSFRTALSVPVDPASSFSSSLARTVGRRRAVPSTGVGISSSSTSSMVGEYGDRGVVVLGVVDTVERARFAAKKGSE